MSRLGLAMTEVIAETGSLQSRTIMTSPGNASDSRLPSGADYLAAAFPPTLPSLVHVVINSMQQKDLARRYGQASTIIPNVIDFETPPPGLDDYSRDFRQEIGLSR